MAVAWPRTEGRLTVKTEAGPRCFPGLVRALARHLLPAGLLVFPSRCRPLGADLGGNRVADLCEAQAHPDHGGDGLFRGQAREVAGGCRGGQPAGQGFAGLVVKGDGEDDHWLALVLPQHVEHFAGYRLAGRVPVATVP